MNVHISFRSIDMDENERGLLFLRALNLMSSTSMPSSSARRSKADASSHLPALSQACIAEFKAEVTDAGFLIKNSSSLFNISSRVDIASSHFPLYIGDAPPAEAPNPPTPNPERVRSIQLARHKREERTDGDIAS